MTIKDYSSTAASNTAINGVSIAGTAPVSNMDDGLRNVMADISNWTDSDTLASASTTDLGSVAGMYVTVSGTATITSFGTLKAGMVKFVYFSGAGQITHNATSMILPGAASITRAAGDTAVFVSEGSGNWRCLAYANSYTYAPNGSESLPSYTFAGDKDTGIFWSSGDVIGFATGGTARVLLGTSTLVNTLQHRGPDGLLASPSYSFSSAISSGMYYSSGIAFSISGTLGFRIQADGDIEAPGVYARTTALAANVYVDSNGLLARSTSGLKYKTNVEPYDRGLDYIDKLLPVFFNSKDAPEGQRYAGFIAEWMHDAGLTEFVVYDNEGKPDAVNYANVTALLAKGLMDLSQINRDMNSRLMALEHK